jgi:hypothetical protein
LIDLGQVGGDGRALFGGRILGQLLSKKAAAV